MNARTPAARKTGRIFVVALCAMATAGLYASGRLVAQNAETPKPAEAKTPALSAPANADELNDRLNEKRVKVDFKNVPIEDVMEYLGEQANINIFIDWNALAEVEIGKDATINLSLRNPVPLRQVLRLALRSLSPRLIFNVDEEVVIIENSGKPDERAGRERITRVWEVKDLAPNPDALKQLRRLVVSSVAPPAWEEEGPARIQELNGQLVVVAPESLQDAVAGFLGQLREAVNQSKEKPE